MSRTAIIIGATGLVGSALLNQLLNDDRFSSIKIFVRKTSGISHPKLQEHLVNFDNPFEWKNLVQGHVLFSALGTTIKKAGSKDNQYRIDHTYQYQFAQAASANHVPVYVLVSAYSANERSRIFYSRIKGELERDVKALPFQHIHIFQPGILKGQRKEDRWAEKAAIRIISFLNSLGLLKNQKPVPATTVAQAMVNASFITGEKVQTYRLLEIFRLAEKA